MTADPYHPASRQPAVDQLRLWTGGLVTAVIAALLTLVIWWVVREVLDIPAVQPLGERAFATDEAIDDAVTAFVATLLATVLLDALLLLAPTPLRFFAWLVGLVTIVLALAPWTTDGDLEPRLARSIGTVIVGLTVYSLLAGAARRSVGTPPPTRW